MLPKADLNTDKRRHDMEEGEIQEGGLERDATRLEAKPVVENGLDGCLKTSGHPPPFQPTSNEKPLTPAQLDQAKSTVLDLLGWGVTPEHLIECGVSSHAIYRIFTDLHLRLPTNLWSDNTIASS